VKEQVFFPRLFSESKKWTKKMSKNEKSEYFGLKRLASYDKKILASGH